MKSYLAGAGLLVLLAAASDEAAEPLTQLREIDAPSLAGAGQQNLTVGPDGRVYLSWIDRLPDSSAALRFAALGASWSSPRTIAAGNDWFVNWADFPSLLVWDRGMAAHWLQRSGRGRYSYEVRVSRSADGGQTWSQPVVPHRDGTPTEHGFVSLWPAGGTVMAAWVDGRKTADSNRSRHEMSLRAAAIEMDGALGPEAELDSRICDCCQTAAAVTSSGPVVVYRDRSPEEIRDIAIVREVGGVWTEPRIIGGDNWRINACPVNGPAVAAEGNRVVVAWYTGANDRRNVKVAFSSDAGASFGEPVMVDDGRPVGRVAVIMTQGDALVSWLEDTPGGAEVRVRRITASGERGESMAVTRTSAARPSGFPRMVRSGDRVVFAWRDPDTADGARIRTAIARIAGNR